MKGIWKSNKQLICDENSLITSRQCDSPFSKDAMENTWYWPSLVEYPRLRIMRDTIVSVKYIDVRVEDHSAIDIY